MSPGKIFFFGKKSFFGLQEAIENLLEDDDDIEDAYINIIPPELEELTDDEDIDEEDLFETSMPNDVPGRIELEIRRDADEYCLEDDENGVDNEEMNEPQPGTSRDCVHEEDVYKNYLDTGK